MFLVGTSSNLERLSWQMITRCEICLFGCGFFQFGDIFLAVFHITFVFHEETQRHLQKHENVGTATVKRAVFPG